MLITASWVEKIQKILGLEAVSQVWSERPAWYFWISDAAGVYHLEVQRTETRNVNGHTLHTAILSLKCYPFADLKMFPFFSFEEQGFIRSQLFDQSNTPYYEQREKVPENLFNIAAIEYTFDPEDTFALFTFESLDAMRVSFQQEAIQTYPVLKQNKHFKKGAVDRRVPGIEIGYPLYGRLLCLYSFYSKRKPLRVMMAHTPGFEYIYDESHAFACVDTPDVKALTVNVIYGSENGSKNTDLLEWIGESCRQENEDVIFDRTFACGCFHSEEFESSPLTPLDSRWWTLASANYKSEKASTCGCD